MTTDPTAPRTRRLSGRWIVLGVVFGILGAWTLTAPPYVKGPGNPRAAADALATSVLHELRESLLDGRGMSDPDWPDFVQRSAMALWVEDLEGTTAAEGRKLHTELAHIAGDMARQLAGGPEARADWSARDPESVRIHDEFLTATEETPAGFRRWVSGSGADLLRRRMARIAGEPPPR